jgi:hypothetical protein
VVGLINTIKEPLFWLLKSSVIDRNGGRLPHDVLKGLKRVMQNYGLCRPKHVRDLEQVHLPLSAWGLLPVAALPDLQDLSQGKELVGGFRLEHAGLRRVLVGRDLYLLVHDRLFVLWVLVQCFDSIAAGSCLTLRGGDVREQADTRAVVSRQRLPLPIEPPELLLPELLLAVVDYDDLFRLGLVMP